VTSVHASSSLQAKILQHDYPDPGTFQPTHTANEKQLIIDLDRTIDDEFLTQALNNHRTGSVILSTKFHEIQKEKYLLKYQKSPRDADKQVAARLISCGGSNAGAFLDVLPILGQRMSDSTFITAIKFRLELVQHGGTGNCGVCRHAQNDCFGNHAVTCGTSGDRIF
jgi:hypothetical protein